MQDMDFVQNRVTTYFEIQILNKLDASTRLPSESCWPVHQCFFFYIFFFFFLTTAEIIVHNTTLLLMVKSIILYNFCIVCTLPEWHTGFNNTFSFSFNLFLKKKYCIVCALIFIHFEFKVVLSPRQVANQQNISQLEEQKTTFLLKFRFFFFSFERYFAGP